MHAAAERFEFAPPPPKGMLRAMGIAVLAHALLLAALTWGVHWKRDANELAVQAELWSAVPLEAAPKPQEAPPPPPPPPEPVQPQAQPKPPEQANADIALARQKKEAEKKAAEKLALEKARLAQEKLEREAQKKAADEKKRQELKQAQEAQRKEAAKAEKELEAQRQANLRRIAGLAGATGDDNARGNAQRSAGPSASYAGRIRARIKPNIVFSDDAPGNPTAEVEVRAAPDGTIVGRKLIKASGIKAWDDAVLKAIDKTEILPRDEDGRVPPALLLVFKPRD